VPSLGVFLRVFSGTCSWDLMGKFVGNLRGSLGCDSPPKSVS
jgi:hypothetical protein